MRAALLQGTGLGELPPTIILLLVIGIILIPLGIIVFRQAEFYAKKKGKLKRSG
jgi:ABC-2 type transport system permease protein